MFNVISILSLDKSRYFITIIGKHKRNYLLIYIEIINIYKYIKEIMNF